MCDAVHRGNSGPAARIEQTHRGVVPVQHRKMLDGRDLSTRSAIDVTYAGQRPRRNVMADRNTGAGGSGSDSSAEPKATPREGGMASAGLPSPDAMLGMWTSWMEQLSASPQASANLDWPQWEIASGTPD